MSQAGSSERTYKFYSLGTDQLVGVEDFVVHNASCDLGFGGSHEEIELDRALGKLQAHLDEIRARTSNRDRRREEWDIGDELVLGELAKEILRSRRSRDRLFDGELFGEPAWDILLELYSAKCAKRKLSVSSVCYVSAVPASTALRWVQRLEQQEWIVREADALDGRRYWLRLTDKASVAMRRYLSRMAVRPV